MLISFHPLHEAVEITSARHLHSGHPGQFAPHHPGVGRLVSPLPAVITYTVAIAISRIRRSLGSQAPTARAVASDKPAAVVIREPL